MADEATLCKQIGGRSTLPAYAKASAGAAFFVLRSNHRAQHAQYKSSATTFLMRLPFCCFPTEVGLLFIQTFQFHAKQIGKGLFVLWF